MLDMMLGALCGALDPTHHHRRHGVWSSTDSSLSCSVTLDLEQSCHLSSPQLLGIT